MDRAVASLEPLILVSAPAGAGKSTAIASWVSSRPERHTAWVQVEEADDDPVRFWSAVAASVGTAEPAVVDAVEPILRTPRAGFVDSMLPALVNAVDQLDPLTIVLDDLHVISNHTIYSQLGAFIDTIPTNVTLIISTRVDPPVRLGRLRVRGQLTEIRATDLRFLPGEAASFFVGIDLSDEEVHVLCERTEGWAAGLALAAVSLSRAVDVSQFVSEFAGDNRLIVDYLSTEMWQGLPDSTRTFFTSLSVRDRICGPLVDALLDTGGRGRQLLETAAGDNQLIVPLDQHGGWYRFHQLLRDLLHQELERGDPQRIVELHSRASDWFVANEMREEAIHHALAAGDRATAAGLIGSHGSKVFSEGRLTTVQGWLEALGDDVVSRYPWLAVLRVWTMVVDGAYHDVDAPIAEARELLATGMGGDDTPLLRGSIEAAAAVTAIANGCVDVALDTIEAVATQPHDYEVTSLVLGMLGVARTWRGRYDDAVPVLEAAGTLAPVEGEHLIAAVSAMFLAIIADAQDDKGRARVMASDALRQATDHHLGEYHQIALAHSVLGKSEDPGSEAARHHGARGVALARRSNEPIMLSYALVAQAEILLASGSTGEADVPLTEARQLLGRCPDPGVVLVLLALAEARVGGTRRSRPLDGLGVMVDELTDRELTVLRLLPSQLTVREIGTELFVSHNTVKGHVKAVYRKLGVNDRALAVQRARELQLL